MRLAFIRHLEARDSRGIKIAGMLAEVLLDAAGGNSVAELGHNRTVSHVAFQLLVGHPVPLQPAERVLGLEELLRRAELVHRLLQLGIGEIDRLPIQFFLNHAHVHEPLDDWRFVPNEIEAGHGRVHSQDVGVDLRQVAFVPAMHAAQRPGDGPLRAVAQRNGPLADAPEERIVVDRLIVGFFFRKQVDLQIGMTPAQGLKAGAGFAGLGRLRVAGPTGNRAHQVLLVARNRS